MGMSPQLASQGIHSSECSWHLPLQPFLVTKVLCHCKFLAANHQAEPFHRKEEQNLVILMQMNAKINFSWNEVLAGGFWNFEESQGLRGCEEFHGAQRCACGQPWKSHGQSFFPCSLIIRTISGRRTISGPDFQKVHFLREKKQNEIFSHENETKNRRPFGAYCAGRLRRRLFNHIQ